MSKAMNFLQARRLGATLRNTISIGQQLYLEGVITSDCSRSEIAEAIACVMLAKNATEAQLVCTELGVNWEKLIALLTLFIEKILPLILPLISV